LEVHTSLRYSCFLRFLKIDQYWGSMRLFVAGIFIFCLFSFKVEIIGDVRIDDLLVVILSVIAFWFFIVRKKGRVQDFSTAPILTMSIELLGGEILHAVYHLKKSFSRFLLVF